MTDTYQRYLANKHGSGVGANLTEQGTHRVVDGVLNAYATSGQQVPASMQLQLEELRDIARSEYEMRGASSGARNILNLGGTYDPLAVGRRERELVNSIMNGARGVIAEPERVALQQARAQARSAESSARVAEATEGDRITLSRQSVRQGEQALRQGEMQLETAKLQHELTRITTQSAISQQRRADSAAALEDQLGDVSTLDIMEVVQADDPALAREMFGEGVSRDVQLEFLTNRLQRENTALQQGGTPAVLNGQGEADQAMLGMAALEVQRAERLVANHGDELVAMVNGEVPLPEGTSMTAVQQALDLQQKRETDRAQLTYDLINDRLDVDGVGPSPAGAGAREDKVETAYRIMSTLGPADLAGLQEQIMAGQGVTLQIPGMEQTLSLEPQQALGAFQLLDQRMTAQAQQNALRATQRQAAETFNQTVTQLEDRIRVANFGTVPQVVQEAIAKERAALADVAFGEGDISGYTSSVNRIEAAMRLAQMDDETIATIIHGRFQSDTQVANCAVNMLARSPDEQLFSSTTNAFLRQVEARAATETPGLFGSKQRNPLTPDRLEEIRAIMINPEMSGEDSAAALEEILGYPVSDLRSMMQSALIGGNFNQGFGVFMSDMAESGALDTQTAQSLMSEVQGAVRTRLEQGESLSTEDYIQTVQTIADVYVTDDSKRGAVMGRFFEALRDVDGSTLFRRSDGSVHQDEVALFAFINHITDPSTPISGAGSVPITELPEVLGNQLEQQIDRAVLGHQRFTNSSMQQQVLASAVHALLMDTVTDPEYPLRPAGGLDSFRRPTGTPEQIDAYNTVSSLPSQGRQAILQYNPALTRFVTGEVVSALLSTQDREKQWYDFALPGFLEDASSSKSHWESVDIDGIRTRAREAGLIGGN